MEKFGILFINQNCKKMFDLNDNAMLYEKLQNYIYYVKDNNVS